ncbi:MAG: hypothetical protein REI95_04520 [Oxalicibacterium faecigallinarum]|uniref:hypothetical protein n=1 Tax=Oxalicibacterium faecigallinarum TaxID=573741 RepID=UPI002806BF6F|nr:hypothetical protein [Oxalicibacterium faecigallinarum]MDQ7968886.1 hypothetical protein [Oxalicibacterium faecigallinarum]
MDADLIGWLAAFMLLLTLSMQVRQQWVSRSCAGVSPWLFLGQISASTGFLIYSYLLDNLIFVLTNALLLLAAMVGQGLYMRNRVRTQRTK